MFRALFFAVIFFAANPVFAADSFNDDPEFLNSLQTVIQAADYNCSYVNKVFPRVRETVRGKEMKVQCNGGNFLYMVIISPSGKFLVEPR